MSTAIVTLVNVSSPPETVFIKELTINILYTEEVFITEQFTFQQINSNFSTSILSAIQNDKILVKINGVLQSKANSISYVTAPSPGGGGSGDLLASNNLSDVANAATSLSNLGGEAAFSKNTAFNKNFGVASGTVLEGDKNAAIVLNTAKVTNATHTGEVTGSGVLTLFSTAISNKTLITAAVGMEAVVNDAGTLKKVNVSDFLGGGSSVERFYLERTETINNATATDIEYFTFVQGGTEISNAVSATGGDYWFELSFICFNTSTSGRVVVNPQINSTNIFSQEYSRQMVNSNEHFYGCISKKVTLSAGSNTIQLQLSNEGSGTARIYEANVQITKL